MNHKSYLLPLPHSQILSTLYFSKCLLCNVAMNLLMYWICYSCEACVHANVKMATHAFVFDVQVIYALLDIV